MIRANTDFEAIKEVTRVAWLVAFEAVATAGNDDDANEAVPQFG